MAEKGNEEITIKLSKNDLWKYSTFVLLAVVVIGAIVMIAGGNDTTYNAGNTGQQQLQGTGDFSFVENDDLYAYVGPQNADVTVVEFFDFQCPYCAIAAGTSPDAAPYASQYADLFGVEQKVRALAEQGKIKFVFGIYSFLGPESTYTGEAALCANEQGKYVEMYDAIFTAHNMHENDGKYSKANLKTMAAGIAGLDEDAFNDCLDSNKYASAISTMASNANAAGVSGTPTFVINGQAVSGSWAQISSVLSGLGVN